MSARLVHQQHPHPHVHALRDGRPPAHTWSREDRDRPDQPPLLFGPDPAEQRPPRPVGHRVHLVRQPWAAAPTSALPDVRTWSASLALAVAEALQGRRPVGQLSRWVDEKVLATVNVSLRTRRTGSTRPPESPSRPAVLRSVHVQCPHPRAVEVSAHVLVAGRSRALALRLEAWYDRWLCTALELDPRGWDAG